MIKTVLAMFLFMCAFTLIPAQPAYAANTCDSVKFLTFPPWYRGLTDEKKDCALISPNKLSKPDDTQLARYITTIGLNVLEIMLQLVAYITVGFIIWGGFVYLTSGGNSSGITGARKMIQNAVIGLVISLFAVVAVSFVAGKIL